MLSSAQNASRSANVSTMLWIAQNVWMIGNAWKTRIVDYRRTMPWMQIVVLSTMIVLRIGAISICGFWTLRVWKRIGEKMLEILHEIRLEILHENRLGEKMLENLPEIRYVASM
jgi:hypothetical protein